MTLEELFNNINSIQRKYDTVDRTIAFKDIKNFRDIYDSMIVPVYNYLLNQGYTKQQVAGIMGNILQESKFDHSLKGGLTQFRFKPHINNYKFLYQDDTWQNHLNYINDWRNGKLYQDRNINYNAYSKNYNNYNHSSPESSAEAFYKYWENPNDSTLNKRKEYARLFYDYFNSLDKELNKIVSRTNNDPTKDFVVRLQDPNRESVRNWEHDGIATHKMSYVTVDDGDIIFPNVQKFHGVLTDFTNPILEWSRIGIDPLQNAINNGDTIQVQPGMGAYYTTHYKEKYPGFKFGGKINYLNIFK